MKSATIQPYLFYGGRCEEALDFYKTALGAHVEMLMRFKDSPEQPPPGTLPPGYEEKVMHATFRIGDATIMASDGCGDDDHFGGFSLTLNVATEDEVDRCFNALADGGTVVMPLDKTFWCERFGMLKDRFGIGWMVGLHPA